MTNYTKMINDVSTNEITIVELTDAEVAELTYQEELATEKQAEADAKAEADAAAKAALLDRLGITADEAKLLLA
jgi:hypothetical protein